MASVAVIGIDFGSRRIGIALSESLELASPHSVIRYGGNVDEAVVKIARIASELEASLLVLGVPRGGRRDSEQITARFEVIAGRLREATSAEVVLWDEAFSTTEAASKRAEVGKNWRRYRDEIDKEAAAVILQSYLDERARRQSSPEQ